MVTMIPPFYTESELINLEFCPGLLEVTRIQRRLEEVAELDLLSELKAIEGELDQVSKRADEGHLRSVGVSAHGCGCSFCRDRQVARKYLEVLRKHFGISQ